MRYMVQDGETTLWMTLRDAEAYIKLRPEAKLFAVYEVKLVTGPDGVRRVPRAAPRVPSFPVSK